MTTISHIIQTKDASKIPFPLTIKLLPVKTLHPHEVVVPSLLKALKKEIFQDRILKNPLLVERENFTVLDGMHRLKAVKELDMKYIPTCLVNYDSNAVKIGSWCRKLSFKNLDTQRVIKEVEDVLNGQIRYQYISFETALERLQGTRDHLLILDPIGKQAIQDAEEANENKYWTVNSIETLLDEAMSLEIEYIADTEAFEDIRGKKEIFLVPPSVDKETVLTHNRVGKLLPPKMTRHVFPARPLSVNSPFSLLTDEATIKEKNTEFEEFLSKKKVNKVEGQRVIDGRFYEEDTLYIFQ